MIQEYSYGAVVYKKENGIIKVLVEHMKLGHVSIPKGHIEKGETPLECTLREIKEETNLDVSVDMSFSKTITYSPKEGVTKDVTFFLATPLSETIISQPEEVNYTEWLEYNKAIELMTYQTDKDTIKEAINYLMEKLNEKK